FDRFLETLGGFGRPKMTTTIYDNCYTCWNGRLTNPGDISGPVNRSDADTNGARLASAASVADVDIVTARGEVFSGVKAQGDIVVAGPSEVKRSATHGRIVVAGGVRCERDLSDGRVLVPGAIVEKRTPTVGRVE